MLAGRSERRLSPITECLSRVTPYLTNRVLWLALLVGVTGYCLGCSPTTTTISSGCPTSRLYGCDFPRGAKNELSTATTGIVFAIDVDIMPRSAFERTVAAARTGVGAFGPMKINMPGNIAGEHPSQKNGGSSAWLLINHLAPSSRIGPTRTWWVLLISPLIEDIAPHASTSTF
jgi:hypothetical protein